MSENTHQADALPFVLTHQPALADKRPLIRDGVSLKPLFDGHVLHVLTSAADKDLAGFLREELSGGSFAVRGVSPGQCFIVGNETCTYAAMQALTKKIATRADVIDQSSGRVRMLMQGNNVEHVLAKGTAVDLGLQAFPVGQSAMTLIGHIGAHITRTGNDSFEVIVLRGFAESLWDDLDQMSREFK